MSKYLLVSLPLTGHVYPMAAVAQALTQRGHRVAWAGSESFLRPVAGPDAEIYPIPLRLHRGVAERGLAATKSRWEGYIIPHARVTRKGIAAAAQEFQPDAMVVDQHAIAAAIVAQQSGKPWATVAQTSMELTRPFLHTMPKVESWIHERMAEIWTAGGLPGAPPFDLRFSPHLVIAFTSPALTGDLVWPPNAKLVGPALAERPPTGEFPWDWLDPGRRHVLVSMGTLSLDHAAKGFYARILQALNALNGTVQAVVLAPDGAVTEPPSHVLVRERVPQLELLPHLDAVVSHGGLNTVCEALSHGIPLVIAPVKGDQAINASQVARAGAGLRVSFDRASPAGLRDALLAVLDNAGFRAAAGRVRESFAQAGGAGAAAEHLEQLVGADQKRSEARETVS
ncbi:MAG TPA: nucleotide disphospho-sugar-binding domain-containing protein [Candidatus Limnocylindrales bacterium]|nr:nucleotide disphospho-sugar-binding domain-containing protein [Candidatus Limnocylindrales bacterium]